MLAKEKVLAKALEGIIERLEEARGDALMNRDAGALDFQGLETGANMTEDLEGIESALMEYETRIDDLTQTLGEEIDNLRGLLETMEADL
jgi:hypothetical protein